MAALAGLLMLLIGSRALALRASGLLARSPMDFDYKGTREEIESWRAKRKLSESREISTHIAPKLIFERERIEIEICEPGSTGAELLDLVSLDPETLHTSLGMVPSLGVLLALKQSHRHLKNSPHFWKTLRDWHTLRDAGVTVPERYVDWLKRRSTATYNYAHPSLERKKADFFKDDSIGYVYDHDSIHEAIVADSKPAYRSFLREGAEVAVDRSRFEACSRETQLDSVVEESCVLAIERSLVPHPGKLSPHAAWLMAFSKVCTSITSGWWRTFAYEGAMNVIERYKATQREKFWPRFLTAVSDGKVRSFKESLTRS